MPSALETLVKILKLEQDTGYQNKAVIGGLKSFTDHWVVDAHAQAKKPEHHTLIEELEGLVNQYVALETPDERSEAIRYMLGRIMGRVPPPAGSTPRAIETPQPAEVKPPPRPPREDSEARQARENRTRGDQQDQPERPPKPERNRPPKETRAVERQQNITETPESAANTPIGKPEPEFFTENAASEFVIEQAPEPEPPRAEKARPRRRERDLQREEEAIHSLNAAVENLDGVGPKMAEKLAAIGVQTIRDLLYCFPRRYDDYTRMLPLNKVTPGLTLTVIGTVRNTIMIKGRRNIDVFNVTIDDGSGGLTASFFGQPYLRSKLEKGAQVVFSGKTDMFGGRVVMNNPEWELLEREALHTRSIVPIYPLTKGLSAHMIRKITKTAIEYYGSHLPDYMPEAVLDRTDLAALGWAISQMHYPASQEALHEAQRRLAFDELILLQLGVLSQRRTWQNVPSDPIVASDAWLESFIGSLPYALTGAQRRAIDAIRGDLTQDVPMNRLLQGDVGSGKTVVAATTMALAAAAGFQAAIMAPTSILAEQHYRGISKLLKNSPLGEEINVQLLTGATPAQERSDILWGLGEGSVQIIIGTHALLEDPVNFERLGMIVIDEQHRFGVEQRGKLRSKGTNPHVLVMTATPIPRTLALTMYADLELTILDEMPPGRTPINTRVLIAKERERAYSFIESQIEKGRQAFVVYPLVEASEDEGMAEVKSAVEEYERLQKEVFPHRTLGLLHGRMSPAEKDEVMAAFSRNETQILVSTSVVEVGIDVPNASVILIEGANRFGLAQLHQFRGRVGRGQHASYCLLISDAGDLNNERLQAMESTTDGFKLAEIDWELRGAGDLLGTRQSGGTAKLGQFMDIKIVETAQLEAKTIYEEDPLLERPEHAALRRRLSELYGDVSRADVS
jgi:ATP-dependent DNA helicase RecG